MPAETNARVIATMARGALRELASVLAEVIVPPVSPTEPTHFLVRLTSGVLLRIDVTVAPAPRPPTTQCIVPTQRRRSFGEMGPSAETIRTNEEGRYFVRLGTKAGAGPYLESDREWAFTYDRRRAHCFRDRRSAKRAVTRMSSVTRARVVTLPAEAP